MGKYNKGLVNDIKKEKEEAARQAELRRKYDVEENVIIKERTNTFKFVLRLLIAVLRLVLQIILILLAGLGCIALVYPEIREPLLRVLYHILMELKGYLYI